MEKKLLKAYEHAILKWIRYPQDLLEQYFAKTFAPLSVILDEVHTIPSGLAKRSATLRKDLDDAIRNYWKELPKVGHIPHR